MPKLIQDNQFVQREGLRLDSLDSAAGPGNALARAGETQRSAALRLEDNADMHIQKAQQAAAAHARFREAARRSEVNSVANDAAVRASQSFMEQAAARIAKKVDKDGNPTFSTLASDLQEIGRTVGKTFGKVGDREAAAKFGQMFGAFMADRTPGILQEQRNQQVEFAKVALVRNIDSIKALGGNDDITAWPVYEEQLTGVLRDGIADGTISALEALSLEKDARSAIVEQGLNKAIWNNPEKLLSHLASGTPEDFGATAAQYNNAVEMAQAKVLDNRQKAEAEAEKKAKEAKQAHDTLLSANITGLIQEYDAGNVDNLEAAKEAIFMDQSLDEGTRQEYSNKIRAAELKRQKDDSGVSKVIDSVFSGDIVAGSSKKDIDGAYKKLVDLAAQQKGEPLTPEEEATIVKDIRGTSPAYVAKLGAVAATGTPEEKIAHARAYQYLSKENYQAVKGLDDTSKAIYTKINQDVDAGLSDPLRAVEHTEKFLLDTDPKVRAEIEKTGWADGKLMADAVLSDADLEIDDLGETSPIRFDIARKYAHNLEVARGDAKVAHAMTVDQVKQSYGSTGLSEAMDGLGPMRTPPEMVAGVNTGNPIEMEALRGDFKDTLLDAANMPEGYDEDDVIITPIDIMGAVVNTPEGTQAYSLSIITDDGKLLDLRKDDGELLYYAVRPGTHADRIVNEQAALPLKGETIQEISANVIPASTARVESRQRNTLHTQLNYQAKEKEARDEMRAEYEAKGMTPSPKQQKEWEAKDRIYTTVAKAAENYNASLSAIGVEQVKDESGKMVYGKRRDHGMAPTDPGTLRVWKDANGNVSMSTPIEIDPYWDDYKNTEYDTKVKERERLITERKRIEKTYKDKGEKIPDALDLNLQTELLWIDLELSITAPFAWRDYDLDKLQSVLNRMPEKDKK